MLKDSPAFSGFSVNDLTKAQEFYGQKLGLDVKVDKMGMQIKVAHGNPIFVYPKDDHKPATFTILNFPVDKIDPVVKELKSKGVKFESYDEEMLKTDENNIARGLKIGMGPDIAWFKDPAGNILSVLQDK